MMKDFSEFEKFCSDNSNELLYEIAHSLKDVPESQKTISKDEWQFIQELIISSNLAFFRWYHGYFFEDTQ